MANTIPDYEAIEDAIVARLELHTDIRHAFAMGDDVVLDRKPVPPPAAAVMLGPAEWELPRVINMKQAEGTLEWSIFAIASGMRTGKGGQRKGATGVYAVVRAIQEQLVGWQVVAGFPMYQLGVEPYDVDEVGKTIYLCRYAHGAEVVIE